MPKTRFAGDIVVITGAASGIGLALVQEFAALGAKVAALDTDAEKLKALRGKAETFVIDVSDQKQVLDTTAQIIERLGKPTIWINNAGIAVLGGFEKVPPEDFERVMDVNFNGVVYGTRAALSVMKFPERGMIVNVSSLNGSIPIPFMSSYVASKHAVDGFTLALNEELLQSGSEIRAVLVSPGFVRTPIMESREGFAFPKWLDWLIENPAAVAEEIARGIARGKTEIKPTLHGRLLLEANRLAPGWVRKSSRLLTGGSWREVLGIKPIKK